MILQQICGNISGSKQVNCGKYEVNNIKLWPTIATTHGLAKGLVRRMGDYPEG